MPRYFFDTRDNDIFVADNVGVELDGLEAVKVEATRSLAELALEILPGSMKRVLAVEVRTEDQPLLRAILTFEAVLLAE